MTFELPTSTAEPKAQTRRRIDAARAERPFNLLRWYAITSLLTVTLLALGIGMIQSHFLRAGSINSDASLSAQFIATLLATEDRHAALPEGIELVHLLDPRNRDRYPGLTQERYQRVVEEFLDHLRMLPDALLISLYATDGTVVWSTNPRLVNQRFADNEELKEAFEKRSMVAVGHMDADHADAEQRFTVEPADFFIENYIPLLDRAGEAVAVVEIYKEPQAVRDAIEQANLMVTVTVLVGTLVGYLVLFRIVRRGARAIEAQHRRLLEAESMALVGEMSQAIAHGLRSPLAAIRSSAELATGNPAERAQKNIRDIISETDRLSTIIGNLLAFAGPMSSQRDPVDILKLVDETLLGFGTQIASAKIRVNWILPALPRPLVDGHPALFAQALSSVIANAIEAMPEGGTLRANFEVLPAGDTLELIISDTGVGMSPEQLAMAMRPFYTSKRKGLGVGLPIVRRVVERFGGSVQLESLLNGGTHVHLFFCISE